MNIKSSLVELIGHTPLVSLQRLGRAHGCLAEVVAKVEYFNPGGSVKDRVALNMIEEAERRGELCPGATIIEPTSGNTGVGLAWISRIKGYKTLIVMPDSMSVERQKLLKAAGADLVLTPGSEGMKGSIARAEQLKAEIPGAVIMGQFTNPDNPAAHVPTTAEEIWVDTDGHVDLFVAGVGTGGTISGVGKGLKTHNPNVRIVAVEPAGSAVLSGEAAGAHKLQGIGAGFIPSIYDATVVDEIIKVENEEAMQMGRELSKYEGLLVGISSGAAVHAAIRLACLPGNAGKRIVVLLPDTGERYLSTELFN